MNTNAVTLPAGVMKRLAEDMGWRKSYIHSPVYVLSGAGVVAVQQEEEEEEDGLWTLTPAGCWLVMNAQRIRKDYQDNGRVVMWSGLSTSAPLFTADTPEAALCAAITNMYREGV